MFATFLNKEDRCFLDLSVFVNYSPEELLHYYYNSVINIDLKTFLQITEWLENSYGKPDNLNKWLDFFAQELGAVQGLENMQENVYLDLIGPYYYGPTNTQIFFSKFDTMAQDPITSSDFEILFGFHKLPTMDRSLRKYAHSRKPGKKATRSKDELIRDITMCAASLSKIKNLEQYILYINKFLERRQAICEAAEIGPPEPAPIPDKPKKPKERPAKLKVLSSFGLTPRRSDKHTKQNSDYNHKMKVYFIRSREYEKACERFKKACQEWSEQQEPFLKKCKFEMKEATTALNEINGLQSVYKDIIRKSIVHPDYQEINILNKFQRYLETGRADDLRGCMNLYEGERHWVEIKNSQRRIEHTIHFLQPDDEALQLANHKVGQLIASTID